MGNVNCCKGNECLKDIQNTQIDFLSEYILDNNHDKETINPIFHENFISLNNFDLNGYATDASYSNMKQKSYHPSLNKLIKLQSMIRKYLFQLKFSSKINLKRKNLLDYFQMNEVLCKIDEIDFYTKDNIKKIEYSIIKREGIWEKSFFPPTFFQKIKYSSSRYMVSVPCCYLLENNTNGSILDESYISTSIKNNQFSTENDLQSKAVYKGYWSLDKFMYGHGILISSNGSKYEGIFQNGRLHGYGRYINYKGDVFDGWFVNGKANGFGVFCSKDDNLYTIYKGQWKDNQPDGNGEEWRSDDIYYKGMFSKGRKNGYGEFTWNDGSSYKGSIVNDLLEGEGEYVWSDNRRYKGMWKENQMNGIGKMEYSKESSYEGSWINNKKSGYGVFYYSKDKYYEGEWLDGKQNGKGKIIKKNITDEGHWRNGVKIENNEDE